MIGWWEASWGNVLLTCVLALVAVVLVWAALEEFPLRRHAPRQRDDWDIRELTEDRHE